MQEIRVSTWTELQDALWDDAWQESLGRFRSDFAFRGVDGLSRWLARYYRPRR